MRIRTDAVGQIVARPEEDRRVEHAWFENGNDEGDNYNEEVMRATTSLWEAEMSALDSEQLQVLQESVEDD